MNFCCFLFLQNPRKLQVVLLYDLDFTMIMKMQFLDFTMIMKMQFLDFTMIMKMQFRTDPWVVIQMLA